MIKKIIVTLLLTLSIGSASAIYATIEQIQESPELEQLVEKLSTPDTLEELILGSLVTIKKINNIHARIVNAEKKLKEAQEKAISQRTKESLQALAELTAAGSHIITLGTSMISYKKQLVQLINFTRMQIGTITKSTGNQTLVQELQDLDYHLHLVEHDIDYLFSDFDAKNIRQRIDQLIQNTKKLTTFSKDSHAIWQLCSTVACHKKMEPIIHNICTKGKPLVDEITATAPLKQYALVQHQAQQQAMVNRLKGNYPEAHAPNVSPL